VVETDSSLATLLNSSIESAQASISERAKVHMAHSRNDTKADTNHVSHGPLIRLR